MAILTGCFALHLYGKTFQTTVDILRWKKNNKIVQLMFSFLIRYSTVQTEKQENADAEMHFALI